MASLDTTILYVVISPYRTSVAVTYSALTDVTKLYVGGVLVSRCMDHYNTFASLPSITSAFIGKTLFNDPTFDGRITDVRIYTTVLRSVQ